MAVRQRGAGWQADVQWKGKREREQFTTEAAAKAWEASALDALKAGRPVPAATPSRGTPYSTIGSLVEHAVRHHWAVKSKNGLGNSSVAHAQYFAKWAGPDTPSIQALSQATVDEFFSELRDERSPSGATVNRWASMVCVISKIAYDQGVIDKQPKVPHEREGSHRLRFFEEHEEALLVSTLRSWGHDRWADFLVALIHTGGRTWTELGRVAWRDIDTRSRVVSFYDTKNGTSRHVPLNDQAWAVIEKQRQYHEGGPFHGLKKDMGRRLYDRIRANLQGFDDTTWYTARHTFASRLVLKGVPIYTVAKLMGHKHSQQTERYAKLNPAALRDAVDMIAPPLRRSVEAITPEVLALAQRLMAEMQAA